MEREAVHMCSKIEEQAEAIASLAYTKDKVERKIGNVHLCV